LTGEKSPSEIRRQELDILVNAQIMDAAMAHEDEIFMEIFEDPEGWEMTL